MRNNKRFLSAVLALVLCLSMLPVSALALDLPELDVLEDVVAAVEEEETIEDKPEKVEVEPEPESEADEESAESPVEDVSNEEVLPVEEESSEFEKYVVTEESLATEFIEPDEVITGESLTEAEVLLSTSNEQTIYNYLVNTMGLNIAAACGVLANIQCESSFRPNVYGDNGTSYGICQWHNERFTALKTYCNKNGYDYTTLNGQLHYLEYELEHSYPGVLKHLKSVTNTADGSYSAGYYWCYYFERPADYPSVSVTRGNLAKNTYWPKYSVGIYEVTFNANGGTCTTTSKSYSKDDKLGTLPTPDFGDLYTFTGWYTEPYGGTMVSSSTKVTGSTTYYAHWEIGGSFGKINFDSNGGAVLEPILEGLLNGVNKDRGGAELVVYNNDDLKSWTNIYGSEVAVDANGKVVGTRSYGDSTQLGIPSGGFVLSGQASWVEDHHEGGYEVTQAIIAMDEAWVSVDYAAGKVYVYDSYAAYLANTTYKEDYSYYEELPVPERDGYLLEGWYEDGSRKVSYGSSVGYKNLVAHWTAYDDARPESTVTYNGHYYELYDYHMSWTEAKAFCEERGGHLAVITTAGEQSAVKALIQNGLNGLYYIGATDAAKEGTWTWVTGETFSYECWDDDLPEPSNGDGEDYSAIMAQAYGPNKAIGEWIDVYDLFYGGFYELSNSGFVCEYEQESLCEHEYAYSESVEPTLNTGGKLVGVCSKCDYETTVQLPALNKTDYTYRVRYAATCTKTGVDIYAYEIGDYEFQYSVVTDKLEHQYVGETYGSTCTEPSYIEYTCTECGDSYTEHIGENWSDWSTTYPDGVDEDLIQSRTEYRYKEKKHTTSSSSTLSGWTLEDEVSEWGDYSSWSSWSTTKATASDSTQVETRTAYHYYYYKCSSCGAHMHGYGTCYTWAGGCGGTISSGSYTKGYYTTPYSSAKDWYGTGVYYITDSSAGKVFAYISSSSSHYVAPVTQYRYRTRALETTYYFYQWGDWSAWSTESVTASDDVKVETRTVFRYDMYATAEHKWDSGVVTTPAGPGISGVKTYTCSACGETKTESIAALPMEYTVTYDANGGTGAPAAQTKQENITMFLSSTIPTREGYTFLGWSISSTAASASFKAGGSYTGNADVTMYAVWKANTYTVTYDANGGTGAPTAQTKTHGEDLTLSTTKPNRTGYTFLGWATSKTATSAAFKVGDSYTDNADITLYAVWEAKTYNVTYNANGGTGAPATQTKTYDVPLTLSSQKPTKDGYVFKGWATDSSATTVVYLAGGKYTKNSSVSLYAVWEKEVNITDTLELSISSANADPGDTVTLTVSITGNPGFEGCLFSLSFDETALKLTDISLVDDSNNEFVLHADDNYAYFITKDFCDTMYIGDVLNLEFEVLDSATAGVKEIRIEGAEAGNKSEEYVTCTASNGAITVSNKIHSHTWDDGVVTAPTCTEEGYTTYACTGNGCTESYIANTVPATGHKTELRNAAEATCTKGGYTGDLVCTACGKTTAYGQEVAATGHAIVTDDAVEPTCTKTGMTEGKHCSVCGTVTVAQKTVAKIAHAWDSGKVTKEPMLNMDGVLTYTCTACGGTKTEKISAISVDINSDGTSNAFDLVALMKHIVGVETAKNMDALDVNGDSKVDILDVVRLVRYLADDDMN